MKIKPSAILFDMDGVLVNSFEAWWKSLNITLKYYNYKEVTRDEFTKIYWGHGLRDNVKKMGFDPAVGQHCNVIYGQNIDDIKIYKDTKYTLQRLNNYEKVVITNTPTNLAKKILEKFSIDLFFKHIITSDDVINEKPDPEIVLTACKKLNVNPKTVALVGDTESDIKAGKAAGCTVIGFKIGGDYKIKSLIELIDILE